MKNGLHINPDGTQCWYKEDNLHREDGPAIIKPDGEQRWFKEGKIHREDGPAVICSDGSQYWYKEGKLYERKMKGEQDVATSADIFYMVYNPLHGAPTVRHTSLEIAEAEAERIAKKHLEPVYVLKSVCKFAPITPQIQKTVIQ